MIIFFALKRLSPELMLEELEYFRSSCEYFRRMASTYLLESEKVWGVWLRTKTMEELAMALRADTFSGTLDERQA